MAAAAGAEGGAEGATVEQITVTLTDREEYTAKLVGRDAATDIAVLKIEPKKAMPFVKFGDSTKARVGDWVVAIGNPFALSGTVTAGIISAVHRGTGGTYDKFIQTDASINQGNSGGPMFDMRGNVIGINSQILSPSGGNVGIGFAIPSEQAAPIVQTLMKGQTVKRGYLGVQISPLGEDLAESLGLAKNSGEFIQGVEPGRGADKAGIKAGDFIRATDGGEWWEAKVLESQKKQLKIHFQGFATTEDTWVPRSADKLRPLTEQQQRELQAARAWLPSVEAGDRVLAIDCKQDGNWYEAKVLESERRRLKIHFKGCGSKDDIWVERTTDRLRPPAPKDLDEQPAACGSVVPTEHEGAEQHGEVPGGEGRWEGRPHDRRDGTTHVEDSTLR